MSRPVRTAPVPGGTDAQEWALYDLRNKAAQTDYRQRMAALLRDNLKEQM